MNAKTTLLLAFSFVVLVLLYYVVRTRSGTVESELSPVPAVAASPVSRDLLETKLGDIVKVVCRREGGEEWVFQKDSESSETAQPVWRMTSPLEMKCVRWEVDKFGNRLGNLKYELSYKPAEPGAITAEQAGLDPPQAVVTLTDADGQTATIEIGKPASRYETYVRLAGSDVVCVGKSDLSDLIKDKAFDYREKQLWDFDPENVTRVEIEDRSDTTVPVSYAFSRDGSRWMMESPVTARATSKVDDMLRSLSRLRAVQWLDDRTDKLAMYGLESPALTIRATVEEQVPVEEPEKEGEGTEGEEATAAEEGSEETAEPETETKVTVYELHVSDRSPIGEDTKRYMRIGDESAVATVIKPTVDKFKPVMSEWREMHVTSVDAAAATRIELTTPEGTAVLVKHEDEWSFQPGGGGAEETVVSDLLQAVGDLKAVAFVDQEPPDLAALGLNEPQAEIRLTVPGVEGVERITVGGYTDETTKRLVYVRRNELASIAKVRKADVAKLIQGPLMYRDRTIVDVPPGRLERITLSTENRFDDSRNVVTFERSGNTWAMIEPVSADLREKQMDKLVEALGGLRAERVVAEEGEASAYGLHAPAATVALTYKPPTEYRIEEQEGEEQTETPDVAGAEGEPAAGERGKAVPKEVQPPSRTLELSVAKHDGKYYAKRSDRGVIYEVTRRLYTELLAEYRSDRVMQFDDAEVRTLSIRKGDVKHVFVKEGDRWVYQAEPDLPLDSKKVDDLLRRIKELRTPRYVRHATGDLAEYGLSAPLHEVSVKLDDGSTRTLLVSEKTGRSGTERGSYATVKDAAGVFLLTADAIRRFHVSLDALEKEGG